MLLYRTNKKSVNIEPCDHSIETSRKKFSERKKLISLSILVVTCSFVLTTTPSAIIMGFFVQDLYKTKTGKLIVWIFDALLFSYHSFKFEIILIFNYQFNKEFSYFLEELFSKENNLLKRNKKITTTNTISGSDTHS